MTTKTCWIFRILGMGGEGGCLRQKKLQKVCPICIFFVSPLGTITNSVHFLRTYILYLKEYKAPLRKLVILD